MAERKTYRLFVAVPMPNSVIEQVVHVQHELKKLDLFAGRYTIQEQMHVTLKFIGPVSVGIKAQIKERLAQISFPQDVAFTGSLDLFGSGMVATVVYLHILCPLLGLLAHEIDEQLSDFIQPERRSFISHITIARIKQVYDFQELLIGVKTLSVPKIEFPITEFVLKESELTPEGPIHHDVEHFALQ